MARRSNNKQGPDVHWAPRQISSSEHWPRAPAGADGAMHTRAPPGYGATQERGFGNSKSATRWAALSASGTKAKHASQETVHTMLHAISSSLSEARNAQSARAHCARLASRRRQQ